MFDERNKGKIIIYIENDNGRINSNMEYRGIANKPEIALTTLWVKFASLSIEKDKDPKELIEKHLSGIVQMLKGGKKI